MPKERRTSDTHPRPSQPDEQAVGPTPPEQSPSEEREPRAETPSPPSPESAAPARPSHVVGIGASAGGLRALERFFSAMSSDSGVAFVIIQHLSPDFKSLMHEILARYTTMPIYRAEDGMVVQANQIYLNTPRKDLTLVQGVLRLTDYTPQQRPYLPINVFFQSLAQDMGERAIGIVLSGTGSDGTEGVRALKEAGGLVIVQDEEMAQFDSMPRSAAATGVADYILPPEEIPEQLLGYIRHPYAAPIALTIPPESLPEEPLAQIFTLLRERRQLDFTHYRTTTVIRRIQKRMAVSQINTLSEYVTYLRRTPEEIHRLSEELLINVTGFFRDPEAFQHLEREVIPRLLQTTSREVRVWVPGCASGEEAYSIAILLQEQLDRLKTPLSAKIFATDLDPEAIAQANQGIFSQSIVSDVSEDRLERFFLQEKDQYRITKQIRDMILFARHNLIKDPPFTKVDLISCRNLLIYFEPVLQKRVLPLLHFALKPNGFLFLGPSETVGELSEAFQTVEKKWKIYQKQGHSSLPLPLKITPSRDEQRWARPLTVLPTIRQTIREDVVMARIYKALATAMLPSCLLVNSQYELLHTFGDASQYLTLHDEASLDMLRLVPRDLMIPLATALRRANENHTIIRYTGIQVRTPVGDRVLDLRVQALVDEQLGETIFLVFLEDATAPTVQDTSVEESYNVTSQALQRIQDLEAELQLTRENLQATIEELEASNEELQSTNEEIESSNEELQSTNEELQSVNQELYTVNAEYQRKITELTELNNDIDNLLRSTDVGTLFLDGDLRIRKFTPGVAEALNVLPQDIGRPLEHIAPIIVYENLLREVQRVLQTKSPIEAEVQNRQGTRLLMRILPYRTENEELTGVVLTFVDISAIKQAEEALRQSERQLRESERLAAIGTITSQLAHEIGNPLNGMYTTAQLLERHIAQTHTSEDETISTAIQDLKTETDRLRSLLRDLRSLARPQHLDLQPLSLAALVADVVDLEKALYDEQGVRIEQNFAADLPAVLADRERLKQVILNVCKNAAEAMPEGGTLSIRGYWAGDQVCVDIHDTGQGILSGQDVFTPFVSTKTEGTGLGLTIVQQIVIAHQGTISYTSEPEEGTTFTVCLPLASA